LNVFVAEYPRSQAGGVKGSEVGGANAAAAASGMNLTPEELANYEKELKKQKLVEKMITGHSLFMYFNR
tara:strand:+ start:842 stop:1048 length:207 start_codon:yes stop_codon:yes gene_type:complete